MTTGGRALAVAAFEAVAGGRVGWGPGVCFALIAAAHCGWVRPPSEVSQASQLPVGVWSGFRKGAGSRRVRQKHWSTVLCVPIGHVRHELFLRRWVHLLSKGMNMLWFLLFATCKASRDFTRLSSERWIAIIIIHTVKYNHKSYSKT